MAPVAPLPFSLADRDIQVQIFNFEILELCILAYSDLSSLNISVVHTFQAIVDAYKEEPGNPKYAFKVCSFYYFSILKTYCKLKFCLRK